MTSEPVGTIDMGEDCDASKKNGSRAAVSVVSKSPKEVALSKSPQLAVFLLHNDSTSENSDSASSDLETDAKMTKDVLGDRLKASTPIAIPKLKVTSVQTANHDAPFRYTNRPESPISSVGDTVYDSPTLPRPSKDFNHVMIKLKRNGPIQRVRSYDNVGIDDSDSESGNSSINIPISSSLPPTTLRKGRRSVRFDETTITLTADLGESAARFRSQWRRKRAAAMGSPSMRFGESKNISVCHTEDNPIDSPLLERASNGKSIFDVCNYSSYGRYT
uniref:Uncharacterized protein LOC100176702 n=1 Tax=Phallusia mammillata TaxID=59560 RepID=A0A6F9DGK3_9ASCI|nr:uncharacterized protein LOC100176702 [Phallusia mammillata]